MEPPKLEPVEGWVLDAEGNEQPQTWWVIRGVRCVNEKGDEVTIAPYAEL